VKESASEDLSNFYELSDEDGMCAFADHNNVTECKLKSL
jgi:hypothetical protein